MTENGTGGFQPVAPARRSRLPAPIGSWAAVLAWAALIFLLSAQPGLRVSDDPGVDLPIRHAAHVASYAILAALIWRALGSTLIGTRFAAVVAILLAVLYGVTDEVHQTYVPNRTGHLVDVGWDLLGALLGVVVVVAVRRIRRRARGSQSRRV